MDLSPIMTGLGGSAASPKTSAAQAMEDFGKMLREGEAQSTAAVTSGADPHALVTALAESKLAVDTVVTVRDRVVEAYQEILRMPV